MALGPNRSSSSPMPASSAAAASSRSQSGSSSSTTSGISKGLAGDRPVPRRGSHPFQHQPLVRGMLVDDDQPVLGLGDDIGRGDLPPGDPADRWDGLGGGLGAAAGRVVGASLLPKPWLPFGALEPSSPCGAQRDPLREGLTLQLLVVARACRPHDRARRACSRAALRWLASSSAAAARRRSARAPPKDRGSEPRSWPDGRSRRPPRAGPRGTGRRSDAGRAQSGRDRPRATHRPASGPSPAAIDEQELLVGHAPIEGRQADDPGQPIRPGRSRCRYRAGPAHASAAPRRGSAPPRLKRQDPSARHDRT